MIIKSYEINKIELKKNKNILIYGPNEGGKHEAIEKLLDKSKYEITKKFDEKEILENNEIFFSEVLNKSLFESEKIILIERATDKLFKVLEKIFDKKNDDIYLIINGGVLEKKSKLRNLFEKNKKLTCILFYLDESDTLSKLTLKFFRERKINISQADINLLINRCNGDRGILKNELKKIELFLLDKKKLTSENLIKLTNLIENHNISDLIDNCLAKNHKKTLNILNENNYTNEDCIIILRTFLNKSKKILKLSNEYKNNKDINLTISTAKPPIFWKDKEITKQQVLRWSPENLKTLIYKLNDVELILKKNINNSVNLITDFLLEQSSLKTNN